MSAWWFPETVASTVAKAMDKTENQVRILRTAIGTEEQQSSFLLFGGFFVALGALGTKGASKVYTQ